VKIASVALLMILSSLGQVRQAEQTVDFRAGFAEQLLTSCRAPDNVERSVGSHIPTMDLLEEFKKSGTCMGFIDGVIDSDTIAHHDKNGHQFGLKLCVPADTSGRQLAKIVVKYGDDHPQQLHFPAAVIVLLAMSDAFPCQ
jgi:hypothetical protein